MKNKNLRLHEVYNLKSLVVSQEYLNGFLDYI